MLVELYSCDKIPENVYRFLTKLEQHPKNQWPPHSLKKPGRYILTYVVVGLVYNRFITHMCRCVHRARVCACTPTYPYYGLLRLWMACYGLTELLIIIFCILQSLQDTAKHAASHSILNSAMFTSLTKEAMCRIKDVHSWRFYFACGMRLLLVGLGVSVTCTDVCNGQLFLWCGPSGECE